MALAMNLTFVGMTVVFLALIILAAIISLFPKITAFFQRDEDSQSES